MNSAQFSRVEWHPCLGGPDGLDQGNRKLSCRKINENVQTLSDSDLE